MKVTPLRSLGPKGCIVIPVAPKEGEAKKSEKKSTSKSENPWSLLHPLSAAALSELGIVEKERIREKLTARSYTPGPGSRINLEFDQVSKGKAGPGNVLRLSGLSAKAYLNGELDEWRKLGGDLRGFAKETGAATVTLWLKEIKASLVEQVIGAVFEGALLAQYEFARYKRASSGKKGFQLQGINVVSELVSTKIAQAFAVAKERAEAVTLTRDLVNTAPSDLPPRELVAAAKKVARQSRGLKLKVFNQQQLKKLGAGMLLGVSKGSEEPPFLIHLAINGSAPIKKRKKIVLVGKGITFDSGGLSIKTGKGMEDMKCDMAGAACVLGVASALSSMRRRGGLKHDVHVLIPTSENMINGRSTKPGDVLRALNGKTVEVLNTDAEGRLVLGDALAYSARFKPDLIVDVATLTGAIVVSLGDCYTGLFCDDKRLREEIEASGNSSGERFWHMPLANEYRSLFAGGVSDLRNISPGGGPGAIIAALFLREFVPADVPWAHLDIAGTAFGARINEYTPNGASGVGVRTLLDLIEHRV